MDELAGLAGMFLAAFLAATLLPAQSEGVLAALVVAGGWPLWLLVFVATTGNVLGSVVNWLLGRGLASFRHKRWFPVSDKSLARAEGWYRRYGRWSLLFAWLPVVGDPLTVVAGTLREPLGIFLVLVTIGKAGRYVLVALVAAGVA
ncbi:YqaA family protein [Pannonibacter sp.]|uniref:YqaA family protein n=1 Tax=Pannonibacter sp. TaxID=1906786 RepID=UPI003F70C25C